MNIVTGTDVDVPKPYKEPPSKRRRFPSGTPAHVKELQRRNRNRDAAADLRQRKRQYECQLTNKLQGLQTSISDLEQQERVLLAEEKMLQDRLDRANNKTSFQKQEYLEQQQQQQQQQKTNCGSDATFDFVDEMYRKLQASTRQQNTSMEVDPSIKTADSNRTSQQTNFHSNIGTLLMIWAVMAHFSSPCLPVTTPSLNNNLDSASGSSSTPWQSLPQVATPTLGQTVLSSNPLAPDRLDQLRHLQPVLMMLFPTHHQHVVHQPLPSVS